MTNDAITPFRIDIPETDLDDLRRRLVATRWPHPAPDNRNDFGRGAPLEYVRRVAGYWADGFDWREQEARLNTWEQATTVIDGQTIHFLHVRSPEPGAVPLLVTHGYPSAVSEFLPMIGPLTDPGAHGGDRADAFHLVIPSLPGYGFSTPVNGPGWELGRISSAFAELMTRLGYDRYGAHGGDIGAGISGRLAATVPDHVIGVLIASDPGSLGLAGEQIPIPDGLGEGDRARVEAARAAWSEDRGYADLQSQRPETIGLALTDSPVGQLAWIAEKIQIWTDREVTGDDDAVDLDLLLTIVSLYWFTRSGATAARFFYEVAHSDLDWAPPSDVPSGWAVFSSDPIMRRFFDPDRKMAFWADHDRGGHFPALSAPELLVEDLRSFFRALRSAS